VTDVESTIGVPTGGVNRTHVGFGPERLGPHVRGGTRYAVRAMHADRSRRQRHVDVGFDGAWGTALDQLASYLPTLAR
jgi:hypothetical protein